MKIAAVVQARMSSSRLPGKVLLCISGKPLLGYVLDRVGHCQRLDDVIVATSAEAVDNPVEEYCRGRNISVYRGSHADVASRYVEVAQRNSLDAFVRVCADSPLLDQDLIEHAVSIYFNSLPDMVTNIARRSYPKGQSVEVVCSRTFCRSYSAMESTIDKEHVTRYFYEHKSNYRIINFDSEKQLSHVQLSVDTQQDLERVTNIISKMARPHWEYGLEEILQLNPDYI